MVYISFLMKNNKNINLQWVLLGQNKNWEFSNGPNIHDERTKTENEKNQDHFLRNTMIVWLSRESSGGGAITNHAGRRLKSTLALLVEKYKGSICLRFSSCGKIKFGSPTFFSALKDK